MLPRRRSERGCLKIVDEEVQKLVDHSQPEWYIPLQAVFRQDKSTKVRLVLDLSSKGPDGLSLNDYLRKDQTTSTIWPIHGAGTQLHMLHMLEIYVRCLFR